MKIKLVPLVILGAITLQTQADDQRACPSDPRHWNPLGGKLDDCNACKKKISDEIDELDKKEKPDSDKENKALEEQKRILKVNQKHWSKVCDAMGTDKGKEALKVNATE